MKIDKDGRLIEQDIRSKYETFKGRASSGRSFAPGITITPEGAIQEKDTVEAYKGHVVVNGPAITVTDEFASKQLELKDDLGALPGIIGNTITKKAENAASKLVLIGAGILLLLLITRD